MRQKYTYRNEAKEVFIDGEISSWWGTNFQQMRRDIQGAGDVSITINSQGGEVTEGFAISDFLRSHSKKNTVQITGIGLVASIATMIHASGTPGKRLMTENGFYMIHNPWTFASGDSEELRNIADTLDTMQEKIVSTYVSLIAGNNKLINDSIEKTKKQVIEWMKSEKMFSAQEALEAGLIDGVTDSVEFITPENVQDYKEAMAKIKNAPVAIMNKIKNIEAMPKDDKAPVVEITEEQKSNFLKNMFGWLFAAPKAEEKPVEKEPKTDMTDAEKLALAEKIAKENNLVIEEEEKEMTLEAAVALLKANGKKTTPKAEVKTESEADKQIRELKEQLARLQASNTVPAASGGGGNGGKPLSREDAAIEKLLQEEGVSSFLNNMIRKFENKI